MNKFSDFKLKPITEKLIGDKIKIDRVFNKEIIIEKYRIVTSKYSDKSSNGKCLHIQFTMNGSQHVLFTGSGVLQDLIEQIGKDNLPFTTTIIKNDRSFEFN